MPRSRSGGPFISSLLPAPEHWIPILLAIGCPIAVLTKAVLELAEVDGLISFPAGNQARS